MSKTKILPCGATIKDCDTFEEIAATFGSIGVALPGRMLKRPPTQEQKQEEAPAADYEESDQKHRTTIN